MNNYFFKIAKFDIDETLLYNEWFHVANKYDAFNRTKKFIEDINGVKGYKTYHRLRINYPDNMSSDMDPVMIQGYNTEVEATGYSIDNIIDDFKGSYTEKIARQVHDFLLEKYPAYIVTNIKYHSISPKSSMTLHIDDSTRPRFFLSASVPEGCFMQINNEKIPMHETGALYRMICKVLHNPLNESDGYRVSMVFDIAHK
jgi:hypothetical protein